LYKEIRKVDLVPTQVPTGSPPIHMTPCGLASVRKALQAPSPDPPVVVIWPLPVGRSSIRRDVVVWTQGRGREAGTPSP